MLNLIWWWFSWKLHSFGKQLFISHKWWFLSEACGVLVLLGIDWFGPLVFYCKRDNWVVFIDSEVEN